MDLDLFKRNEGLAASDVDWQRRYAFLSAHPEKEHHEVFLMDAPDKVGPDGLQQASFRCASLDDVIEFKRVFAEENVRIDEEITHGNAVSIYFFDPVNHIRLELTTTIDASWNNRQEEAHAAVEQWFEIKRRAEAEGRDPAVQLRDFAQGRRNQRKRVG